MELKSAIAAARTLVSSESASQHGGTLSERLRGNMDSFHALLKEPVYDDLLQEIARLRDEVETQSHNIFWEFSSAGLGVLHLLDTTLKSIQDRDQLQLSQTTDRLQPSQTSDRLQPSQTSDRLVHPTPPADLLSVPDQKVVSVLVQFIISLGLYPFLLPGVDVLIKLRIASAEVVAMDTSLTSASKAWHLSKCCAVLLNCFENPILGPLLMPRYLTDVLAALLQVCYGPAQPDDQQKVKGHSTSEDLPAPSDGAKSDQQASTRPSAKERERCMEGLQRLLNRVHQPLIIRELITLQSMSVGQKLQKKTPGSVPVSKCPRWLQKACGQLLSERLMQRNGVQHILRGLFEATSGNSGGGGAEEAAGDWRKCQAIARILSSCPAQATSVEDYYSLVCPQVIALLHLPEDGAGRQFLRVAVASISAMMARQHVLARRYIKEPLMRPLMQLAGDHPLDLTEVESFGSGLQRCVQDLNKICSVVEPSSPLVVALLPYLPVLFDVWRVCQLQESRNIISRVLKPTDAATILHFLKFVVRISSHLPPDEVQESFRKLLPNYSLHSDESSSPVLTSVENSSSDESVETMESIAGCVLDILRTDLQDSDVPSQLFLSCLQHLATELSRTTGYDATGTCIGRLMEERKRNSDLKKPATTGSSSALLDLEEKLERHTSAESFSNALVLYLTASLCEHMSEAVLERVELPILLEVVSVVTQCHAYFVSSPHQQPGHTVTLQVVQPDMERLLGGSITLTIVFGLLSAILGGAREVAKTERPLLSAMLPSLQTVADQYPDEELSSLANDLRICIATLGAVWSAEMKESVASAKKSGKLTKKAKSTAASGLAKGKGRSPPPKVDMGSVTGKPLGGREMEGPQQLPTSTIPIATQGHTRTYDHVSEKLSTVLRESPPPQATGTEGDGSTAFSKALDDVKDPLVPVKGHGLLALSRLLEERDPATLANQESLLALFREHLSHPDSYIYLAAIKGLVVLASLDLRGTLPVLCQEYAQLSSQESTDSQLSETGQLQRKSPRSRIVPASGSFQVRLKLGEALVRVIRDSGELLPYHSGTVLAAVLVNARDPEPLIRASSLSNLADICPLMQFSFAQVENEILSCVRHILQTDDDAKVCQAALVVLKELIKGVSQDILKVLGDSMRDIYRLLKQLLDTERDELTRTHILAVLGELDIVMRDLIFPQPVLSKKITILDHL